MVDSILIYIREHLTSRYTGTLTKMHTLIISRNSTNTTNLQKFLANDYSAGDNWKESWLFSIIAEE